VCPCTGLLPELIPWVPPGASSAVQGNAGLVFSARPLQVHLPVRPVKGGALHNRRSRLIWASRIVARASTLVAFAATAWSCSGVVMLACSGQTMSTAGGLFSGWATVC
jgi:hypothetical protein